MTTAKNAPADIVPTCDMPLSVASEELTGFEVIAVQKQFGATLDEMGGVMLLMGVVWAFENRDGKTRSWTAVKNMTMRELSGYFQPEPEDDESPLDRG